MKVYRFNSRARLCYYITAILILVIFLFAKICDFKDQEHVMVVRSDPGSGRHHVPPGHVQREHGAVKIKVKPSLPVKLYLGHYSKIPVPSVVLRPLPPPPGGIGDQLYRYAFAYTVARDLNTTLYVAVTSSELNGRSRKYGLTDRMFALDKFKLDSNRVKFILEATLNAIPDQEKILLDEFGPWRPHELPRDKIIVVTEYWQSDMFFGRYWSELVDQFVPIKSVTTIPNFHDLVTEVRQTESVAVHVRRGDFMHDDVATAWNRVLPISYQIRAIELVLYLLNTRREEYAAWLPVTFFIFSDDIEYSREHFSGIETADATTFVYVSNLDSGNPFTSIEEFELMCLCKHHIIPNSGFSWWAGWLNPNPAKLVVAPFPRHRYRFYPPWGHMQKHKEDLYWNHTYPSTWLTLNPYVSYEDMM